MAQNENKVQGDCTNFEQDLVLYYYGECDRKDHLRVETHLEGCGSCRRFLDELCRLLPLTSKLDQPDEAFWDAYSREIHGKLAEVREKPSKENQPYSSQLAYIYYRPVAPPGAQNHKRR